MEKPWRDLSQSANQNKRKDCMEKKAWENASGQFAIGSSFASDWGQVIVIS